MPTKVRSRRLPPVHIDFERLRKIRKQRGLTQKDLERDTGVSQAIISKIERGTRPRTWLSTAAELARGLRVSLDYLCSLSDDPRPR